MGQQKTFIYVLKLIERLHGDATWSQADEEAVSNHFDRLKRDADLGVVILAGRTEDTGPGGFGLVIFRAPDLEAAQAYMLADPAVAAGIMEATVQPYRLALLKP